MISSTGKHYSALRGVVAYMWEGGGLSGGVVLMFKCLKSNLSGAGIACQASNEAVRGPFGICMGDLPGKKIQWTGNLINPSLLRFTSEPWSNQGRKGTVQSLFKRDGMFLASFYLEMWPGSWTITCWDRISSLILLF